MDDILRRFDVIECQLKDIQYNVEKCKRSGENMDRHITFIESFWKRTMQVFSKRKVEKHAFEDIV